jgi:hypothetical protein
MDKYCRIKVLLIKLLLALVECGVGFISSVSSVSFPYAWLNEGFH